MALTTVIMLGMGTLAMSLVATVAVAAYADSVHSREMRIQKRLNESACAMSMSLMKAKDHFLDHDVYLPEFGCTGKK